MIDETQELSVSMLSELRFVLNYQTDSFSPLTVIFVGSTSTDGNPTIAGARVHSSKDYSSLLFARAT